MASTSPVHPLWPISAPCCSALSLLSTMEDNGSRAQQQRSLFISVPLCLALFSTRWCSHLISLSPLFLGTYLHPLPSLTNTLSHAHISGQEGDCGVLNYSDSWQKVSPSMNTNVRASIHKCLFMNFAGTVQRPQIRSFPAREWMRSFDKAPGIPHIKACLKSCRWWLPYIKQTAPHWSGQLLITVI